MATTSNPRRIGMPREHPASGMVDFRTGAGGIKLCSECASHRPEHVNPARPSTRFEWRCREWGRGGYSRRTDFAACQNFSEGSARCEQ